MGDTLEKCILIRSFRTHALWVSKAIIRRNLEVTGYPVVILGGGENAVTVEVSQYRAPWVSRVLLRIWSWTDCWLVTLGKRFCTFIAHVSRAIDLFKLVELNVGNVLELTATIDVFVEFYSEDGLESVTLSKRLCSFIVEVSRNSLFIYFWVSSVVLWRCLEMARQFFHERALSVGRIKLVRWPWNYHLSEILGKRVCTFTVKLSWDAEVFIL